MNTEKGVTIMLGECLVSNVWNTMGTFYIVMIQYHSTSDN